MNLSISLSFCCPFSRLCVCWTAHLIIYHSLVLNMSLYTSSICLSTHLSLLLCICHAICLSVCLSFSPPIFTLSIHPQSVCMLVFLSFSFYLFVSISRCLSVCLSSFLSVCLSDPLTVCLSLYLSFYILVFVYNSLILHQSVLCPSICSSGCPSICPSVYLFELSLGSLLQ